MSKSFYHKITEEQWKIIKSHLPKPKSTGRPSLNPQTVLNFISWKWIQHSAKFISMPPELVKFWKLKI